MTDTPTNTDEIVERLAELLAKATPGDDYAPRYVLPRYPVASMMSAGLYQCGLHRCAQCEEKGDDHSDLFSAWHDMVDAAKLGDAFNEPCLDILDFLPALLAERAEMKARIAEMKFALRAIASCESFHKDDVVSIARQALNSKPDPFAKWADGLIDGDGE
jgi:hypothetical protein